MSFHSKRGHHRHDNFKRADHIKDSDASRASSRIRSARWASALKHRRHFFTRRLFAKSLLHFGLAHAHDLWRIPVKNRFSPAAKYLSPADDGIMPINAAGAPSTSVALAAP